MVGSVVVPLAGIVASRALVNAKRRYFQSSSLFYPVLAIAQPIFWAVTMRWLRALSPAIPSEAGDGIDFYPRVGTVFTAFIAMNEALLVILVLTRRVCLVSPTWLEFENAIDWALPLLVTAALIPFASKIAIPPGELVPGPRSAGAHLDDGHGPRAR